MVSHVQSPCLLGSLTSVISSQRSFLSPGRDFATLALSKVCLLYTLASHQPGNATCKATSHSTEQRTKLPFSPKHPASKKPAALQGEKGRQDSPEQEADTADTACGQGSPLTQLDAAKDRPSAELPGVGLSDLVRGGVSLACRPSHRGG